MERGTHYHEEEGTVVFLVCGLCDVAWLTTNSQGIQVDNSLIRCYKSRLIEESEVFMNLFSSSTDRPGEHEEGSSDENPIRLEGIRSKDFQWLLDYLDSAERSVYG